MQRIFLSLAVVANLGLGCALALGLGIEDATLADLEVQSDVNVHFLTGLGSLTFAILTHALVLTYFMGTGRWIEETAKAYRLPENFRKHNQSLKYRTLPVLVFNVTLLILTGASGGAADPASPVSAGLVFGLSPATAHLWMSSATLALNILGNVIEYRSLSRNATVVREVLTEVQRIRTEHGLPV